MNRLLTLLSFVILFVGNAFSDCAPFFFRVWPEGRMLNRNPLIVLNFSELDFQWHRESKSVVPEIGKKIHFSLKSEKSEIPLRLIQRNRGQTNENQLLLKPDHLLEPNMKYELVFSCKDSILRKHLLDRIRFRSQSWTTNEVIDKIGPSWLSKPKFLYKNFVHYGCGPESYWTFCVSFEDHSAVFVQTIVRHLESGKVAEFLLSPDSSSVIVGYHMCGGAFDMIPGERYSVSFNLVDASGNTTNQFTDPIFVRAPLETDYISDEALEKKICHCNSKERKEAGISLVWVLTIIGLIVLIAVANWYGNYAGNK